MQKYIFLKKFYVKFSADFCTLSHLHASKYKYIYYLKKAVYNSRCHAHHNWHKYRHNHHYQFNQNQLRRKL